MSWKSFLTAGFVCVLASPVFAAPAVTITNAGLNASGNWVWNVSISNTDADGVGPGVVPPTGDSPLAAELGFRAVTAALVDATNPSSVGNFDTPNPGKRIFTWETLTNLGGGGACNSPTSGNCPVGLQKNIPTNEVFSALGSIDYTTLGPHPYITIVTKGPTAASSGAPTATRKTSLQMLGAYAGLGRIAEATVGTPPSANYDTYSDQQFRVATAGDTDLINGVGLDDFNAVLSHIGLPAFWQQGNFHANDGTNVDLNDFNTVLGAIGQASGVQGAGAGPGFGAGLSGGAVPEPTSALLLVLGSLALVAKRRRK